MAVYRQWHPNYILKYVVSVAVSRNKRATWDFSGHMSCRGVSLGRQMKLLNYGCWCGYKGGGPTKDDMDK